jgi:hypothetical protein
MKAVNLLPSGDRRGRGFGGGAKVPVAVLCAAVVVGGLGYWTWSVRQDVAELDDQIAIAEAANAELEQRLGAYQAARQRYVAQDVKRGSVVSLTSGRVNWERLIRNVSATLPTTAWLTNVKAETPEGGPAGAPAATAGTPQTETGPPRGLHLEGYAYTQPQVAQVMSRLSVVPGLGDPHLTSSERELIAGRRVFRFVIDTPITKRAQDRPTLDPVVTPPPVPAGGGEGEGGAL